MIDHVHVDRVRNAEDLSRRTLSLRLDGEGRPASLDEGSRTVEVVAATQTPVTVYDYELGRVGEMLLMSGCRIPESGSVPLLDTHGRWSVRDVIGSARGLRVEGETLLARAKFSEDPDGQAAYDKVRAGHLTDVSVGYRVHAYLRVSENSEAQIEGRTITGPMLVATDWEIKELSFCPIGADPNAKARAAAETQMEDAMDKWLRKMRERLGMPADATEEQVRAELERRAEETNNAPDPEPEPARPAVEPDPARSASAAERQRASDILALCERHGVEPERARKWISDGISVEQAQQSVLDILAARREGEAPAARGSVTMGATETERHRVAVIDALCLRAGLRVETPADGARDLMYLSLRDLPREYLQRAGLSVSGSPQEIAMRALHSTDLPNVLGAVVDRSVAAGWEQAEETYEAWCDTSGSLPDFEERSLVKLSEFDDLEEVPEAGEYKAGTFADALERVKLLKFGKTFTLTWEAMLADNLGMLTDIPTAMGEAARRKVGDLPAAVLTANPKMADGKALFHADHKNLATSGAVIGVQPLTDGLQAMAKQRNMRNRQRLNIRAKFLLAPVSLMGLAEEFFKTEKFRNADGDERVNIYAGERFTRVYEARLDDVSEAAWFLAAARNTVKIYWLNGIRVPHIERLPMGTVDGASWKIRLAAAAAPLDWRGLYKNPGE